MNRTSAISRRTNWQLLGITMGAAVLLALALAPTALAAPGAFPGDGPFGPGGPLAGYGPTGSGAGLGPIDRGQYLADELGISVEELQAAVDAAFEAALDDAIASGDLTEEQGELIRERHEEGTRLGYRAGIRVRMRLDGENFREYLAAELGISVSELEAAMDDAHDAAVEDLIDSGAITQEQADRRQAASALHDYLDPGELAAAALGMDVDELMAARQDGTPMRDLLEQQGIDLADFHEAMSAALEGAIEDAVDAGVLTQAQADLIDGGFGIGIGAGRGRGPGGRW